MDDETKRRIKAMMNKLPLGARGNVVTHLPPQGLDRDTPEGLSATYFYIGMECASDAGKLSKASPHFPLVGQYILSCHALEVSLKSFLAREGLSEKKLRCVRFGRGHDLIALYDEAVKRGLDFSQFPDARAIVNVFNQYHYKLDDDKDECISFALRYDAGAKVLPSCETLLKITGYILRVVERNGFSNWQTRRTASGKL
jgi:hypothetical protein